MEHRGKIEIVGKSKDGSPLNTNDIIVKLDGKELPFLRSVEVNIAANREAFVILRFVPIELDIKMDETEILVRRKETYETT